MIYRLIVWHGILAAFPTFCSIALSRLWKIGRLIRKCLNCCSVKLVITRIILPVTFVYCYLLFQVMWLYIYFFLHKGIITTWKSSTAMQHLSSYPSRTNNALLFAIEMQQQTMLTCFVVVRGCLEEKVTHLYRCNWLRRTFVPWNKDID